MSDVKIFGSIIEDEALRQIDNIAKHPAFQDAKIRIMPDVHAGKGCVCGFTADLGDKVVPNLVGVDIGCGILAVRLDERDIDLKRFDEAVRRVVPCGQEVHEKPVVPDALGREILELPLVSPEACLMKFAPTAIDRFRRSIGTLGSGNHFISIERADDGTNYLLVHSGSRNFGKQVCDYYQELAYAEMLKEELPGLAEMIQDIKRDCIARGATSEIEWRIDAARKIVVAKRQLCERKKDLAYLTGDLRQQYIHDMRICQQWARCNRLAIAYNICDAYDIGFDDMHDTMHNYLGDDNIIRKSAISARKGEKVTIPMNMRDGSLICVGRGNPDWNYSAPHGAGRIMSRSKAKKNIALEDFKKSMEGIYTTSCVAETIDEAPVAYKPMGVIMAEIHDTVDVIDILRPIYNFKGFDKK